MLKHPTGSCITVAYPGVVHTEIYGNRLRLHTNSPAGPASTPTRPAMSAERAARIMAEGHARGERDVLFSVDGSFIGAVKTRVLRHLCHFAPALGDTIVTKTAEAVLRDDKEN